VKRWPPLKLADATVKNREVEEGVLHEPMTKKFAEEGK
jgi:hypothetical protein